MRIGTQLLSASPRGKSRRMASPGSRALTAAARRGPDPGTGTSLAIVGYPVSNETGARPGASDIVAVSSGSPGTRRPDPQWAPSQRTASP